MSIEISCTTVLLLPLLFIPRCHMWDTGHYENKNKTRLDNVVACRSCTDCPNVQLAWFATDIIVQQAVQLIAQEEKIQFYRNVVRTSSCRNTKWNAELMFDGHPGEIWTHSLEKLRIWLKSDRYGRLAFLLLL